ncbi:hepatic lectin-like [Macrobrachium nipponense]|uniref:hepatic lectin-like n=1 Tax=Macrobrachium nipponense TaxID=159736 RepID=UPI0030C86141
MGGDYVKIDNTREWNFVASHVSGNSYVGLTDAEEEGTYKWISDGTVHSDWQVSWWHRGQPDNHNGGENCIHYWLIYEKLLWNDAWCKDRMRHICEMKASDVVA